MILLTLTLLIILNAQSLEVCIYLNSAGQDRFESARVPTRKFIRDMLMEIKNSVMPQSVLMTSSNPVIVGALLINMTASARIFPHLLA